MIKLSKQILKSKPKIKFISYSVNGEKLKLKVKVYGKVREDIITSIENTIHFLPDDFKTYLVDIVSFEIRKSFSDSVGVFDNVNFSLKIYDHPDKEEFDYSQTFLHELGHLIFHQYLMISEDIEKKYNENPVDEFVDDVKDEKIKPISEYLDELKADPKFNRKYDYPNELFAGYFAFTYSRYSDEGQVKGSFCNYIKLRNLFWLLVDAIETSDANPFNEDD